MRFRKIAKLLSVLAACACTLPGGGFGQPYTPKGNPWEAAARGGSERAPAGEASADPKAAPAAKGDAKGAGESAAPAAGGGTILEQLEAARARIQKLEGEGARFKTDNASLSAVVEQLRKENQNLAQAAETSTQARTRVDQEIEQLC